MDSISKIATSCKGMVDQMDRSAQSWRDEVQRKYYNLRLNPMISSAADYQLEVSNYMRLLDEYEHRIAEMAGFGPMGSGIGERGLYRQQMDPRILEYISKQR